MILLLSLSHSLSFFFPWDAGKLLAVATARIRRLRFGPAGGIHARNAKLNSQKRIAKSRGDDVARIITMLRAGTPVISHNWSSFREPRLQIEIYSYWSFLHPARRATWDPERNMNWYRNTQRPSYKKGEIKGSTYLVGTKMFPWENEVPRLNEVHNL